MIMKKYFFLCVSTLTLLTSAAWSAKTDIFGPAGSVAFGTTITVLPNGNFVVTDPEWDKPSPFADRAGAVHLYGPTGTRISSLYGTNANDRVGFRGVMVLPSGDFIVLSPNWRNGAATNAGAVTQGDKDTGFGALDVDVSTTNSLVGSSVDDRVGEDTGWVTILPNGNYVVRAPDWNQTTPSVLSNAGAVTFVDATTGLTGPVSTANSLVGDSANDQVGLFGVRALSDSDYVVLSPRWRNPTTNKTEAGAVTWGSGTTGVTGIVTQSNSLVGTSASDGVGTLVRPLTNGHYVVGSRMWYDAANFTPEAGAFTWCNGDGSTVGTVNAANSVLGTIYQDHLGDSITALPNGNYVVCSQDWSSGRGAAMWCNGSGPTTGTVSSTTALVGATVGDRVGNGGATALTNGNYVVTSRYWNGSRGAATWGSGTTGITGTVSASNSLVGSTAGDEVSSFGVEALTNGNFVVTSPDWRNTTTSASSAGAVTWGSGTTGITGTISAANSLVGTKVDDEIGWGDVLALSNGNYVVQSIFWNNGSVVNAGAVTWGNGSTGTKGAVSTSNSLVGSHAEDFFSGYIKVLPGGKFGLLAPSWDNGTLVDAGAATIGSGTAAITGVITSSNSLVGAKAGDGVGGTIDVLSNGNYVISAGTFDRVSPAVANVGAVTWRSGAAPITGTVTEANSFIGAMANDFIGLPIPTSDGNYIVYSSDTDRGGIGDAGSVTLCDGSVGTTGVVTTTNSLVGAQFSEGDKMSIGYIPSTQTVVIGRHTASINRVTLLNNAPEIAVEQPAPMNLITGSAVINFGSQTVGTTSIPKVFTIKNVGEAPLTLESIQMFVGDTGDYTINTTGTAMVIPVNGSTTFSVTFTPSGATNKNATLIIESDDADEDPFEINLTGLGTPPPGIIAFEQTGYTVNENVGTALISVVRTGGTFGTVKAKVASTNGSATAGDYTALAANTEVTFTDGVTQQNVSVNITPGTSNENNETFTLTLSDPTGTTLGTPSSVPVTIIDLQADGANPGAPTIASPKANEIVPLPTGATFNVTGTATDGKGVKLVEVNFNNAGYVSVPLGTPGGTRTTFSRTVTPLTGPNTVKVRTTDYADRPSPEVTHNFTVTRPLVVNVNSAHGSVTAGFDPSSYREVGKSYTIVATAKLTPAPGYVFDGWAVSGGPSDTDIGVTAISRELPSLTFTMREGLVLTASFTPNRFAAVAGTYNGLVHASPTLPAVGVSVPGNATEGFINATVQPTGGFTVKVTIDGLTLNSGGVFDNTGNARFGTTRATTVIVRRPGKPSVELDLFLDLTSSGGTEKISGTVTQYYRTETTAVSSVDADRSAFDGVSAFVPDAYLGTARATATYTSILEPEILSNQPAGLTLADYPQGFSIASVTVSKAGIVTVTANLADGTAPAAFSSTLSKNLECALFTQLYDKQGFLSMLVKLNSADPESDMASVGNVLWAKPYQDIQHYPFGWPEVIKLTFKGARYKFPGGASVIRTPDDTTMPPDSDSDTDALPGPILPGGNVELILSGGFMPTFARSLNLTTADAVIELPAADPNYMLTVTRTTGKISGTFKRTDDGTSPAFLGMVYQKGSHPGAYGYFLTTTPTVKTYNGESGPVTLLAKP